MQRIDSQAICFSAVRGVPEPVKSSQLAKTGPADRLLLATLASKKDQLAVSERRRRQPPARSAMRQNRTITTFALNSTKQSIA